MTTQETKAKYRIDWKPVIMATKKIANYTFLLLVLTSGFFIGRISHDILPKVESKPTMKFQKDISIAVNESNQMLIIDKKSGKYEMFQDSVGVTIFKMYANRIYTNQPK
jgi:hypothetical protein